VKESASYGHAEPVQGEVTAIMLRVNASGMISIPFALVYALPKFG
jgi:hypothetical protein